MGICGSSNNQDGKYQEGDKGPENMKKDKQRGPQRRLSNASNPTQKKEPQSKNVYNNQDFTYSKLDENPFAKGEKSATMLLKQQN